MSNMHISIKYKNAFVKIQIFKFFCLFFLVGASVNVKNKMNNKIKYKNKINTFCVYLISLSYI